MSQIDNRRLARNTIMLYSRTAFGLFISLLTSRVVLQALGIEDYGINSAVAGIVALLEIVTGSLEYSISRFITFEIGHGNTSKLRRIFSTSFNIQLILAIAILLLAESVGVWFLNSQMNIPAGRMEAANWVLQCTFISFFVTLTQIPYSACIIGHEKMSAYAYFSIASSVLRLVVVYLLFISPYDKLVTLATLNLVVSVGIRFAQRYYCSLKFAECKYSFALDKDLLKEMTKFTSWNFLTNGVWILSSQGINILINIFYGVTFNAARGVANALEGIVKKFVNDFMTAMNPQITKSYAAGEHDEMNRLICRGTKFAYYLMYILALPLFFEANFVLNLWLGLVPDYAVFFFRLTIIGTLIVLLGQTGSTAVMATGKIKWYCILTSILTGTVAPLTYLFYKLGAAVEISYIIFIVVYALNVIMKLFIMRNLWSFPIKMYLKETIKPITLVTALSTLPSFILWLCLSEGIIESSVVILVSILSAIIIIYMFGLSTSEKELITNKTIAVLHLQKENKN